MVADTAGSGLVLLGLPLYLSRLVGWPLVLATGAALAILAVVAVVGVRHTARVSSRGPGR